MFSSQYLVTFRSIPTFYKFTCLCTALGLDGFLYEIPGPIYGEDVNVSQNPLYSFQIVFENKEYNSLSPNILRLFNLK